MRAYQGETVFGLSDRVLILFIGLVFFAGCSTPAVSKPQESAKIGAATQKQAKAVPSKTAPISSLEALQKGKEVGTGPLQDINFDFDRYDLRPDAREILKKHAAWLKANPQVKVAVEGHADERGTNEYNLALGAKRADSVKRFLVDLGVSANRLGTVSYGEELPLCKEQNEICWAKNRRAHFAASAEPAG